MTRPPGGSVWFPPHTQLPTRATRVQSRSEDGPGRRAGGPLQAGSSRRQLRLWGPLLRVPGAARRARHLDAEGSRTT